MRVCIVGSGISGLTAGRVLSKNHEVTVYEKQSLIGGIARTKVVEGVNYHMVGGHCLNSKNEEVMDFIFNEVLPKHNWHHVQRNAKIYFKDHFVSYPIEFSIKEIAQFDKDLAFEMTRDFLSSQDNEADNLASWFEGKFGATLAKEYFIPYNRKIWQRDPKEMSHLWIEGKLPLPNKKEFFESLIDKNEDTMPHSTFYYPNTNVQNTFIEALAKDLNILTNSPVNSIEKVGRKWLVNDSEVFDYVVSTMPLDVLPFVLRNTPEDIKSHAQKLKYNKITNMLWETEDIDFTWSYYPSKDTIFHRHIHIGNFFLPKKNYTITESMGEHSYHEMLEAGSKFKYLLKPVDYHVSEHAYVVYDQDYSLSTKSIKKYLNEINLYTLGRFGEWEYYNMDICMQSAFSICKEINKG